MLPPVVEDFASGIAFASSARKQRIGCADAGRRRGIEGLF
jgi:hypothetical protein